MLAELAAQHARECYNSARIADWKLASRLIYDRMAKMTHTEIDLEKDWDVRCHGVMCKLDNHFREGI